MSSILLRVCVNGEEFVVAGEASMCVLSAHVSAVGKLGPESAGTRRSSGPEIDLKPGDTVVIEVLEGEPSQPATSRSAADTSTSHGLNARRRWLNARSLYFRLMERFGSRAEKQDARFRRHIIKSMRAERG
jgi:hypothetical protein